MLIFELRSFLDCLDGVVFRAHTQTQRYKSYYGDLGYYVDALSDILAGICLVIGCLLYFSKHRVLTWQVNQSLSTRVNDEETDMMIFNLEDEDTGSTNHEIIETKRGIFIALTLFALRYSLAGMFWDRSVRGYEELLDSYTDKAQQLVGNHFLSF